MLNPITLQCISTHSICTHMLIHRHMSKASMLPHVCLCFHNGVIVCVDTHQCEFQINVVVVVMCCCILNAIVMVMKLHVDSSCCVLLYAM